MLGGLIGGGLGLLGSLFGADKQSDAMKKAAKAATPVPYGVSGPAGGMTVDPKTKQIQLSMADNPFAQIFNMLGASSFANAAVAPGQFLHGANPEIAAAYKGMFGQGLTDNIQSQLDLLRSAAAPEEARAGLKLDNQLFSRGQLGTTGGAERFRVLQETLAGADLQRQLAAVGLGNEQAANRFQAAMGGVNQGMAGQLQQFNIGQGAFGGLQNLLQNLFQQANIGLGASSGTPQGVAMAQAQAAGAPFQAGFNFLNNSGAFSALGNLISGGPAMRAISGGYQGGGLGGGVPLVNGFKMPTVPNING